MAGKSAGLFACMAIPLADFQVLASGYEGFAVRRKCQGSRPKGVWPNRPSLHSLDRVPKAYGPVLACGGQDGPIHRTCQTSNFSFTAWETMHFALIGYVPNSDRFILPSRCQKLCVWNGSQTCDFIRMTGQFSYFLSGGGVPEMNSLAIR